MKFINASARKLDYIIRIYLTVAPNVFYLLLGEQY